MALKIFSYCENAGFLSVVYVIKNILSIIFLIAPIIAILFIIIDFSRSVIAGRVDDMSKNLEVAIKRIIYCVAVFLTPFLVSFVLGLLSDSDVDVANCITNATPEKIEYYREFEKNSNSE